MLDQWLIHVPLPVSGVPTPIPPFRGRVPAYRLWRLSSPAWFIDYCNVLLCLQIRSSHFFFARSAVNLRLPLCLIGSYFTSRFQYRVCRHPLPPLGTRSVSSSPSCRFFVPSCFSCCPRLLLLSSLPRLLEVDVFSLVRTFFLCAYPVRVPLQGNLLLSMTQPRSRLLLQLL